MAETLGSSTNTITIIRVETIIIIAIIKARLKALVAIKIAKTKRATITTTNLIEARGYGTIIIKIHSRSLIRS